MMRASKALAAVLLAVMVTCWTTAVAGVSVPKMFSDHAVLQRDIPLRVWGTASPGEAVTVSVAGQDAKAAADAQGRWTVRLAPLSAGGPHELIVKGRDSEVVAKDVLVGDVWLCAGQSNIGTPAWTNSRTMVDSKIRLLNLGRDGESAPAPKTDIDAAWTPFEPEEAMRFSLIGCGFAQGLRQQMDVPIGMIMCTSWGSSAEPYVAVEALRGEPALKDVVDRLDQAVAAFEKEPEKIATLNAAQKKKYDDEYARLVAAVAENDAGLKEHWERPETDVSTWGTLNLPGNWEKTELAGKGGSVWFRREVQVPASWEGKDSRLYLGAIDELDETWFNGTLVGTWGEGQNPFRPDCRRYTVPGKLVKAGTNVLVVRVRDYGFYPGSFGQADYLMKLTRAETPTSLLPTPENAEQVIALAGAWRWKAGYSFARSFDFREPELRRTPLGSRSSPGGIYNGMIAPLIPYGMKGVIWYQGESNGDRAAQYEPLLTVLINSWRQSWGQENLAFLVVQLPAFIKVGKPADWVEPAEPGDMPLGWAAIRESQLKVARKLPQVYLVVTADTGDRWDIHPNNKGEVTKRLVKAAAAGVYGGDADAAWGPIYDKMSIEKGSVRLHFLHASGGLVARAGGSAENKDAQVNGFAVAGEDRKFVWAKARIDGDTVIVSADGIEKPVAVRYAFWAAPLSANLCNTAGLPASPFRTDDWELTSPTVKK